MRETSVLGQNLCMLLGLSILQILVHDMVGSLDTGLRCGWVPGRYDGLDIGWG